jgi:hypothetical protein
LSAVSAMFGAESAEMRQIERIEALVTGVSSRVLKKSRLEARRGESQKPHLSLGIFTDISVYNEDGCRSGGNS